MGRPAKPIHEKRQQIGVRTSSALKAMLENAAAENGRSVAQEAEFRLENSFLADDVRSICSTILSEIERLKGEKV